MVSCIEYLGCLIDLGYFVNAFCNEVVAIYCKNVLFYLQENNFHASLKVS